MSECSCFRAADAFSYVDTYRRLVVSSPAKINGEKDRLEELVWSMKMVPSRTIAELRAHEDALKFLLEGKEPGTVRLAEAKDGKGEDLPTDKETIKQKDLEILDLQNKIRLYKETEYTLQVELVQKNQELTRLRRKMAHTYSTISIIGATSVIVFSVLLFIYLLK